MATLQNTYTDYETGWNFRTGKWEVVRVSLVDNGRGDYYKVGERVLKSETTEAAARQKVRQLVDRQWARLLKAWDAWEAAGYPEGGLGA